MATNTDANKSLFDNPYGDAPMPTNPAPQMVAMPQIEVDGLRAYIKKLEAAMVEQERQSGVTAVMTGTSLQNSMDTITVEDAVVEKIIKGMRTIRGTVLGRPLIEQQVHYLATIVFGSHTDEWAYRDIFPVQVIYHDKGSSAGGLVEPKTGAASVVYTGGDTLAVFKIPKAVMDTELANGLMAWMLLMPKNKGDEVTKDV